jgi:RNA 2',3'-cyclic 3'-phosphodiesterase
MNRLFLAIPARIDAYNTLKKNCSPLLRGRWTPESQLHLTLHFLGTRFTPESVVSRLVRPLPEWHPAVLRGLGYFAQSRILYADAPDAGLTPLHRMTAEALGLPITPLTPHVTLMRLKRDAEPDALRHCRERFAQYPLGMLLPEMVLFESALHAKGARHRALQRWVL